MDLSHLRRDYTRVDPPNKIDFLPDPIKQFQKWMQAALEENIPDANAMTLSTASKSGEISARTVLLKYIDENS